MVREAPLVGGVVSADSLVAGAVPVVVRVVPLADRVVGVLVVLLIAGV